MSSSSSTSSALSPLPSSSFLTRVFQQLASSSTFWQIYYTSNDAWVFPFLFPLVFWTSMWIHTSFVAKKSFAKVYKLHDFHHVVAITMGLSSIYWNDDSIFNERIVILWSVAYMIVDAVDDVIIVKDYVYIVHGVTSLTLGLLNYNIPLLRQLRMHSKGIMIELSTIAMHQAKQTKDPLTFLVFAILFTLTRIFWIPIMMKELYDNNGHWFILTCMGIFYILQVHWWFKILKIILKHHGAGKQKDSKKKDEENCDATAV